MKERFKFYDSITIKRKFFISKEKFDFITLPFKTPLNEPSLFISKISSVVDKPVSSNLKFKELKSLFKSILNLLLKSSPSILFFLYPKFEKFIFLIKIILLLSSSVILRFRS